MSESNTVGVENAAANVIRCQSGELYGHDMCAGNPTKIQDLAKLKIINKDNTEGKPNNLSVVSRHFNINVNFGPSNIYIRAKIHTYFIILIKFVS